MSLLLSAALAAVVSCDANGPGAAAPSPFGAAAVPRPAGSPAQASDGSARSAGGDANDTEPVYNVPVGKSPTRGNPGALVTIVEFADYQCPYCLRGEQTLRALSAEYGDKLRVVFKNEPLGFHEGAEPAVEGALELRDEKGDAAFWTMHDLLLENQGDLDVDTVTRIAVGLGANEGRVRDAIAKHTHQDELQEDLELADDLQAEGTPHFFVNGVRIAGAVPKADFEAVIERQIPRAKALIAAGTQPDHVYEALTGKGLGAPEPPRIAVEGLPSGDPARGPAGAKVTLHEFGDFQCPYCAVVESTVRRVASSYGDSVRIVWHDFPLSFHDHAFDAARAAREARAEGGDAAFWKLHDSMLANPRKLSRDDLDAQAKALGLGGSRWKAALDGDAHGDEVEADKRAASAIGVEGTPAFVIARTGSSQGYALVGAQPFGHFRRLIERVLAESSQSGGAASAAASRQP